MPLQALLRKAALALFAFYNANNASIASQSSACAVCFL
jgi:hypothetical protein